MQDKLTSGVIAIIIAMAMSGIAAVGGGSSTTSTDEFGCDLLFAYRNDVYQSFAAYPEFLDWWAAEDSTPIDALKPDDAEVLVEQGGDFVETLEDLDVPLIYEDGNEGIAGLYGWFNDLIAWVVLEEGREPDTDDLAASLELVKASEEAAAEECSDAVDDLDGFVLLDPAGIDTEEVPEDPGDVDKNFL
jgi:hypothetical protein